VKRVGVALAILVVLASSSALAADPPTGVELFLFHNVNQDGRGVLFANTVSGWARGSMTWQACMPDAGCAAAQPRASDDRVLDVGDAPSGTTFIATASDGSQSFSATSASYRGRLGIALYPGVKGRLRTGHVITPVPGIWVGGWGYERPNLQLQVCRTQHDESCEVISATFYWEKCPGTGARIPQRYLGWYVRVADQRIGQNTVFAARGYRRPQDLEPLRTAPDTAVATVGRIGAGRGPNRRC
jgi:hypothetical protein